MSKKYCGVVVLKVVNTRSTVGDWLAAEINSPLAAESVSNPRPLRSCTTILKPPPVPRPRTGGGAITNNCAPRIWLFKACVRFFTRAGAVWPGSRSLNGFKTTKIAAAFGALEKVAPEKPAKAAVW
jgi:hypothetical protein